MKTKNVTLNLNNTDEHKIGNLVQFANQFESKIHIEKENIIVNCKSIMGMLGLDLSNGKELTIVIDGTDEDIAFTKLINYLEGNYEL